jgi:membrane-bound lytic murein transglycosylase A
LKTWPRLSAAALAGALLLAACAETPTETASPSLPAVTGTTAPRTVAELPGWRDDDIAAALPALRASCGVLAGQDDAAPVGPRAGSAGDWRDACAALPDAAGEDAARRYVETWFAPIAVIGPDGPDGLFTGYYEPELAGSRTKSPDYGVPLYRPPGGGGAFTRAEIDDGALAGRQLELLWLADPIDAFFLHVQGSGRVRLPDGATVRVGYAGNNGHDYTAIGRILVDRGELTKEAATMQTVRAWLRDHPDQAPALMRRNARYIFFREIDGDGPVGALGVALTPGRSLAVDPSFMPLGAPVWLDTTYPAGTPEAGQPLRRLVVAQDKGAAIKGAVRGDIFFGGGESALLYAGPMKQRGRYFLLVPKPLAAPGS